MSTPEERAEQRKIDGAASDALMPSTYNIDDFVFDLQQEKFWHVATKTLLGDDGVDSSISKALWEVVGEDKKGNPKTRAPHITLRDRDLGHVIDSTIWWPGMPEIIPGIRASAAGRTEDPDALCLNLYRPFAVPRGDAANAMIWVNLVKRLWPEEAETFLDYCAHMIQKPEEKCNWACILSGKQGIGKDTILAPLRAILGHGNVGDTSPDGVLSAYHPWVQNLLLVVSLLRNISCTPRSTRRKDAW
jgi:hypothetical protein